MAVRTHVGTLGPEGFAGGVLEALADAVLVSRANGQVVFANAGAADLLRCAGSELVESSITTFLPEIFSGNDGPQRRWYDSALPGQHADDYLDLLAVRADSSELAVQVSLGSLVGGGETYTVVAIRDVSSRVRSDAQLHRILRTLDASDDAIFIFDATTLYYLFVNDGAVRLTGYSRVELLEMTPLDLSPDTTEDEARLLVEPLIVNDASSAAGLTRMVRKDGTSLIAEMTYQIARSGPDVNSWVVSLARDTTGRLARDAELARSRLALAEAKARADTVAAVIQDRERIGRDLHDTAIQRLFGEGLSLQSTLKLVDGTVAERIGRTMLGLDETIKELRMAVFFLQGSGIAPGGLRGRLVAAVTDAAAALGFEPRLQFEGAIETIDVAIGDELVKVVREALSNVARHAGASTARVGLVVKQEIVLTVSDDGAGVPDEVFGGRGLGNMDTRARALGGRCSIANQPTGGTLVTWAVPTGIDADPTSP